MIIYLLVGSIIVIYKIYIGIYGSCKTNTKVKLNLNYAMVLIHQKVDSNNLKSDVDKLEKIY